jgi:flagellar hook-associated protein 3 FlgL
MRVADISSYRNFLLATARNRETAARANLEIATGKRLLKPSDDPAGVSAALNNRAELALIEQHQRAVASATDELTAADSAIDHYENLLIRAKTLISRGISDPNSAASREALATEIDSLRQAAINVANTQFAGHFIFAGSRSTTPPYTETGGVVSYKGDDRALLVRVSGQAVVQYNVIGQELFGQSPGVFDTLARAASALRQADKAELQRNLDELEAASNTAAQARTRVGATLNFLSAISDRLTSENLAFSERASKLEAADLVEAITRFQQAQQAVEAGLAAGAKILNVSLLDFLG